MKYGTMMHKKLEVSSFNDSNEKVVLNIVNKLGNINNTNIYKEYEFITNIDNKEYHDIYLNKQSKITNFFLIH